MGERKCGVVEHMLMINLLNRDLHGWPKLKRNRPRFNEMNEDGRCGGLFVSVLFYYILSSPLPLSCREAGFTYTLELVGGQGL